MVPWYHQVASCGDFAETKDLAIFIPDLNGCFSKMTATCKVPPSPVPWYQGYPVPGLYMTYRMHDFIYDPRPEIFLL